MRFLWHDTRTMSNPLARLFLLSGKKRLTWKKVGLGAVWLLVIGAIIFFSFFIYLEQTLPDPGSIAVRKISESTKIYDRTGQVVLYDIHGEEKRTIVPWEQIPQNLKNATLAAEDSGFYTHGGFDVKGILRSFYVDFTTLNFSQGGSTITQQLVKKAILGDKKTPIRKIKEIILTIEIQHRVCKDQIFWLDLNH